MFCLLVAPSGVVTKQYAANIIFDLLTIVCHMTTSRRFANISTFPRGGGQLILNLETLVVWDHVSLEMCLGVYVGVTYPVVRSVGCIGVTSHLSGKYSS